MALQEPKLYTLSEVLHDRLFQVPPYQRGYSWTAKERGALFQDLETSATSAAMNTLWPLRFFRDTTTRKVKTREADRLRIFDVVDGKAAAL